MNNFRNICKQIKRLVLFVIFLFIPLFLTAQQSVPIDSSKVFEMSLEDLLNTSVTTVSKTAEKQSDAPGIISVVTKDEIERFGGTTLKDILERVPGLTSYSTQFSDLNTIVIRGDQSKATSAHVLVLINGRPVREVQEGGISSEILHTFPVNIIEKIEVIKGPGSVLYGSDAFSGVVNIITENAERNSVSVIGTTGDGGSAGSSVSVTLKTGDLNIVAAGKYLEKAKWEGSFTTIDRNTNAVTTINSLVPNEGPGAYMGINYKNLAIMAAYNDWTSFSQTGGKTKWNKLFTNLGYSLKMNDKWNMDFNTTYTKTGFDAPLQVSESFGIHPQKSI